MRAEVVSPNQKLFSGEATAVLCRTTEGEIQFLPDHAPFIGVLGTGVVRITKEDGTDEAAAIRGGFVEVSNNNVTILSDQAVLGSAVSAGSVDAERDAALADKELSESARNNAVRWAEAQAEAAVVARS